MSRIVILALSICGFVWAGPAALAQGASAEKVGSKTKGVKPSRPAQKNLGKVPQFRFGMATSVVFSADGRYFGVCGGYRLALFDFLSGKLVHHIEPVGRPTTSFWDMTIAQDNRHYAAGRTDGSVIVWDMASGEQKHVLDAHNGKNVDVAFAAGGKLLATMGEDKSLQLWNVATGKRVTTIEEVQDRPAALATSPKGDWLAFAGKDGKVHLYNMSTRTTARRLPNPGGRTLSLAFSHDGKLLAAGGTSRNALVWDVKSGKQLYRFDSKKPGSGSSVAFSADGNVLSLIGIRGVIDRWNLKTGKQLPSMEAFPSAAYQLAYSPDGRYLAAGGGKLFLAEVNSAGQVREPIGHTGPVAQDAVVLWQNLASSDAKVAYRAILTLADQPNVAIPLIRKRLVLVSEKELDLWVRQLASSKAGVVFKAIEKLEKLGPLAKPALQKAVKVEESAAVKRRLQQVLRLLPSKAPAHSQATHLQGLRAIEVLEMIGNAGTRKVLELIEKQSLQPELRKQAGQALERLRKRSPSAAKKARFHEAQLIRFALPKTYVTAVSFSPSGKRILAVGNDSSLRKFDLITGQKLASMSGAQHDATFLADGKFIAVVTEKNRISLRTTGLRRYKEITLPGEEWLRCLVSSPDGRYLAAGGRKKIWLWEADSGKVGGPLTGHDADIWDLAFSPDGRMIASCGNDSTITLWEVRSRTARLILHQPGEYFRSIAFAPDGKTLIVGKRDGTLTFWNLISNKTTRPIKAHSAPIMQIDVSESRKLIVTCSPDKTIKLWDLRSKELLASVPTETRVMSVAVSPDGRRIASGEFGHVVIWDVERILKR